MNKLKRIIISIIFIEIFILYCDIQVFAADYRWPGVNTNSLPGEYANMEYCVYNTKDVLSSADWDGSISKWYSNNNYILINDSKSKEIKFLNIDGTAKRAIESFVWDKSFNNQEIFFGSDLYEYLVDENGILNCKTLYFIERYNSSFWSVTGSLGIYSPNKIVEDFPSLSKSKEDLKLISKTGVTGTHYGETIKTKCDEYYKNFKEIEEYHYANVNILDKLRDLANSEYQEGMATTADEYFDEFLNLYNKTKTDLENLGITENVDGKGFYINNCSKFNNLTKEYDGLKGAIDSYFRIGNWAFNRIQTKLNIAINNGTASEDDKSTMEEIKAELEIAQTEWREYKEKINLGNEIKDASCEGLLGPNLLDDISTVLTWIRIAVPILLIVLGSVDFATAVLSDDQQVLKKASGKFVKRCIIAIGIFFVPTIIMYLLSYIDKIADVSCDIRLW